MTKKRKISSESVPSKRKRRSILGDASNSTAVSAFEEKQRARVTLDARVESIARFYHQQYLSYDDISRILWSQASFLSDCLARFDHEGNTDAHEKLSAHIASVGALAEYNKAISIVSAYRSTTFKPFPLEDLSEKLQFQIISLLSTEDLTRLRNVSKRFHNMIGFLEKTSSDQSS
eukprot:TRINITY_DN1330_c0_g1_i1.p1 TRINITY_DN1330_c0_g1~~TRINITY_DN1330_c0_g1_i1.p1  ORF type:complete len:175 (+),score=1.86 TRINITY_DN1330_c0_g1_i1:165-689(+)